MAESTNELRRQEADLLDQLVKVRSRIGLAESCCKHNWNIVQSSESYTEMVPDYNDVERHGVDFWYRERPLQRQRPVWLRTCLLCGKSEKTTATRDVVTTKAEPVFR